MSEYGPATYGDRIAEVYDDYHAALGDPEHVTPAVDALAKLAGGGRALELGIGTGRVALPLAACGVDVHGIDASEAMVARLRAKEGGQDIPVTIGDFADVAVEGLFSLVFVVFNPFFAVLTQTDQVKCFRNVAKRLTEDGVFVIDAFVPDLSRFVRGQTTDTGEITPDSVNLEVSRHHPVDQRVTAQHIYITESGIRMYPVQLRYAWPSELDLMARLAGMRLRDRWGDWRGSAFTASSTGHVSVYERVL